jgi:hypothetical protein
MYISTEQLEVVIATCFGLVTFSKQSFTCFEN